LNKGQIIAGDFLFSISIFLLVLGIALVMFNYVGFQVRNNQEEDFMHITAMATTNLLIKTEGSPANWSGGDVKSIGLVTDNLLNQTKVIEFVGMNYDTARSTLKIANYEMKVTFNDINDTLLNLDGTDLTIGTDPITESQVIKLQRTAIISDGNNRIPTVMEFVLWRRI